MRNPCKHRSSVEVHEIKAPAICGKTVLEWCKDCGAIKLHRSARALAQHGLAKWTSPKSATAGKLMKV